jgi:pimeloyl-ACP methyl ester carboxylesterase
LAAFDIYSLGYATSLAPDIRGVWRAQPNLTTLGEYLVTRSKLDGLASKQLAVIAHSMGGLVVQRALLTDAELLLRLSHVILFGTPSGGLRKASWLTWWKQSLRDMASDGEFVTTLRSEWTERFGPTCDTPFEFVTVAGDLDTFVPPESSLQPFPPERCEVVLGDHGQIVKPESADSLSCQLVARTIQGRAAPGGPWSAARVALERRDFLSVIDALLPHAAELDDIHVVKLALALDGAGYREQSIDVLRQNRSGTDARGTLAGRLKRRWLAEGRWADAEEAETLYAHAFEESKSADDASQVHYHGINLAFMVLACRGDAPRAAQLAEEVLPYVARTPNDPWQRATEGEAHLYLGNEGQALEAYRAAVSEQRLRPRDLESMYQQASLVAGALNKPGIQSQLDAIFRSA